MDGTPRASGLARAAWIGAGLVCVAIGGIGAVVPGLPTTIFLIGAAACFTRSSPRLERWVLGLPGVGQSVRDHRDGLGMPRRAKRVATAMIIGFAGLSTVVLGGWTGSAVAVAGAIGVYWVWRRVPTKEEVTGTGHRD